MDLQEKQAEVEDLIKQAQSILEALRNAESCETEKDFRANLIDARGEAAILAKDIRELLS